MEIPFYQDWYLSFVNKGLTMEQAGLKHVQKQNRRKLRGQGMNSTMVNGPTRKNEIIQQNEEDVLNSITNATHFHPGKVNNSKINKKNKQDIKGKCIGVNKKKNNQSNERVSMRNDSVDYTVLSNEIFYSSIYQFNRPIILSSTTRSTF
ncbi:unnamed protein product [Adineta steineri]|uniref:Uncharacterized protein n=1 Tax=Adineta steineri TaxID=433720 RepID=A0A815SI27_9BILA|nr:unnamed protein product [Adineta steineri]CAF3609402.1 unnamed protein product [Adineta steineri]